jgi:hypothetical protein
MKSSFNCMVVLLASAVGFANMTFDDIDVWTGTGANQAALVIDWNDGPSELVKVWGFRWDGTATGADMLRAVCAADPDFYAMGYATGSGIVFGGFGYNTDADENFDITNGTSMGSFIDGYMAVNNYEFDGWHAADAADNWAGGWWVDGFWSYNVFQDGVWGWPGGSGASDRTLQNGSWDGWSWAPDFNMTAPSVTPVPEPAAITLLAAGLLMMRSRK